MKTPETAQKKDDRNHSPGHIAEHRTDHSTKSVVYKLGEVYQENSLK